MPQSAFHVLLPLLPSSVRVSEVVDYSYLEPKWLAMAQYATRAAVWTSDRAAMRAGPAYIRQRSRPSSGWQSLPGAILDRSVRLRTTWNAPNVPTPAIEEP